jgi:hypothetical protein
MADQRVEESVRTALEECDQLVTEWAHWAGRNRRLSLLAGLTVVWSASMIPVCIVVSTQTGAFVFGRLLPSLLGALAAAAAGAAQVVRPHDRWRILERQRFALENERLGYVHRVGDYASGDPDRLLLERVIAAQQVITDEYQSKVVVGVASALDAGRQHRSQ